MTAATTTLLRGDAMTLLGEPLLAYVSTVLFRVRRSLWDIVESNSPLVTETSRHLIGADGKLFRPLLTVLGASLGPRRSSRRIVDAAVVCELTHLASLHHDDVMDEGTVRRGRPTVNVVWGNNVAVLTGDYLAAVAAEMSVNLGHEAQRLHAQTARRLVSGQMHETVGRAEGQDPFEHYLSVARDKTASLIATSAQLGALLAGAREESMILASANERLGIAFQIADDLADLTPAPTDRKPVGSDLRERVATLPVLYAKAHARLEDERLLELVDGDLTDSRRLDEAMTLLRGHPGVTMARIDLHRYLRQCCEDLGRLPDGPTKYAFVALAHAVVNHSWSSSFWSQLGDQRPATDESSRVGRSTAPR